MNHFKVSNKFTSSTFLGTEVAFKNAIHELIYVPFILSTINTLTGAYIEDNVKEFMSVGHLDAEGAFTNINLELIH